ncbi:MAG: FAD binding domain-containing protein, partial [Burkholderiales bacterium]
MYAFEYHRPSSSKEALDLAKKKSEGKFLAGGQSLVQAMKLRLSAPSDLIDLNSLTDLKALKAEGSTVVVGAMVRHAEVAASSAVQKAIPALAQLAGMIGDRQVRHMGTIGGSLANNDPAADYPAAVLGLGATITTNKRKIEADKFFKGLYETALETGELITSVSFPAPKRAAYMKFKNPASRFALV